MLLVAVMGILYLKESKAMDLDPETIRNYNISTENWTSCEQFVNNSFYDKMSVIDVDWIIFYFWGLKYEQSYHIRFNLPSKVLIDRFRIELDSFIQPKVNWSESELFVETSIDLSGLFIRTVTPGKFRFIPSLAFKYHTSPLLFFAMKIVDGMLGMMNCNQKVAYALVPMPVLNKMTPEIIESSALKIGFWNPLGRSYLMKSKSHDVQATLAPLEDTDDADDDIEIEINREKSQFHII